MAARLSERCRLTARRHVWQALPLERSGHDLSLTQNELSPPAGCTGDESTSMRASAWIFCPISVMLQVHTGGTRRDSRRSDSTGGAKSGHERFARSDYPEIIVEIEFRARGKKARISALGIGRLANRNGDRAARWDSSASSGAVGSGPMPSQSNGSLRSKLPGTDGGGPCAPGHEIVATAMKAFRRYAVRLPDRPVTAHQLPCAIRAVPRSSSPSVTRERPASSCGTVKRHLLYTNELVFTYDAHGMGFCRIAGLRPDP